MFDWQFGEEPPDLLPSVSKEKLSGGSIWFLLLLFTAAAAVIITWYGGQTQLEASETKLRTEIQTILDLQYEAVQRGDGALYLSFLTADDGWQMAQLQPIIQQSAASGLTVTRVQQRDDFIWANLTWTDSRGESWQRLAFYQWQNGRWLQAPADPVFWGTRERHHFDWGMLILPEADAEWVDDVGLFVAGKIEQLCYRYCLAGRLPITVELAEDWGITAVPGKVRLPSPRLVALDSDNQPAPVFYQLLEARLTEIFTPAVIRFAVPPPNYHNNQTIIDYDQAAQDFMADNPDITVELVHLEVLPDDLGELAYLYDGAAVAPSVFMVAHGDVFDLTDFAATDPAFNAHDFYEQIWRGAEWHGRIWFMPIAAQMQVIYYDRAAYQNAELPLPSRHWSWEEMNADIDRLIAVQPPTSDLQWSYLDTGLDSLYAYAYNWQNPCAGQVTVRCSPTLNQAQIAAALDWYRSLAGQPGKMADVSLLMDTAVQEECSSIEQTPLTRGDCGRFLLWNIQTTRRQAAIWVDLPMEYERQLLLKSLGVTTFPGFDNIDGVTPLWVEGGFVSMHSKRPLAVWQWLTYLSTQRPRPRYIPARPSVAEEMGFWRFLPRPLGNVMYMAFPYARPVRLDEKVAINWNQVTAVVNCIYTSEEAAQQQPKIYWFRRFNDQ
ncbi:MAG: hypothetical protein Kow0080_20260 [Candidatus Promineifilaceae bacterium]